MEPEAVVSVIKAPEVINDDDNGDDAITCNICFEPWSNTGTHRISSLKCGHFFGLSCIEKWLNSTGGNDCPTCNEKATKRDIRHHYVAQLKAIDTGDKDRALAQVESLKKELRTIELEQATLKVTNLLQKEEIDKLKSLIKKLQEGGTVMSKVTCDAIVAAAPGTHRLTYVKRLEILKADPSNSDPNRCCRVMAYNETYGMLVVSQPSHFTALAPGYGIRRVHMLDKKLESFVNLHKDPIRDLAFNPVNQDQLLSVSQDKSIRLTNVSSCAEIQRYHCESEIWACCWSRENPQVFYVGSKRSQIFVYDMSDPSPTHKFQLEFPIQERRPIIGLCHVPKSSAADSGSFTCSGLFVMTLGSLWFFEEVPAANGQFQHKPHRISIEGLFWSLHFNCESRLLLVNFRPNPHARHAVVQFDRINVSQNVTQGPDYQISTRVIFDNKKGGTYKEKSFLRSVICQKPGTEENQSGQMVVLYGRGSAQKDHKLIVQEVGSDRVMQEVAVSKPLIDICVLRLNSDDIVCLLTENDLHIYKWVK